MANRGAVSQSLNCGASYTIPAGYHNGSGKVTANSLASQTGVDSGKTAVGAGQMLTGYQGWVNGNKITGTMANYSGSSRQTITPSAGTGNQTVNLNGGYHDSVIVNRTTVYDSGVTAAQSGTWDDSVSMQVGSPVDGQNTTSYTNMRLSDVVSIKVQNKQSFGSTLISYTMQDDGGSTIATDIVPDIGQYITIPNGATRVSLSIWTSSTGASYVNLIVKRQYKSLR